MSTEVVSEMSTFSKSCIAYDALVRLLSRVDTLMVLKGDKLGKRCAAYTTAERTLASMRTLVDLKGDKLGKRCAADTTGERTLPSMRPFMVFDVSRYRRLVRAEPAPVLNHTLAFPFGSIR